jgi:phosphate transport system substrate-binding protein
MNGRMGLAMLGLTAVLGTGSLLHVASAQAEVSGKVEVDGSSTVYPITEAVAEEFNRSNPKVRVTVGISGTGGGFKRFVVGEIDISDASRPIKDSEAAKAKESGIEFIEVPVAYDGLSIVVNPANDWATTLTVDQLKKMFLADNQSTVTKWSDVNPAWPARAIKFYVPGTDSGTFDYFKEVVAGKSSIRSDMSVSEDDNILVTGVEGDRDAIGFFGCAYYFKEKDKLKAVAIVNGEGKAVSPSAKTIETGEYNPFSRPLFIYLNTKSMARPEVKAFVDFYLDEAPELSEEVGYVRLPGSVYDAAKHNVKNNVTGSFYLDANGKPVHGSVTKVYKAGKAK